MEELELEQESGTEGRERAAGEDPAEAPAGESRAETDANPLNPIETSVQIAPDDATADAPAAAGEQPALSMDELLAGVEPEPANVPVEDAQLRAVLEAIVYVAEEPLTLVQLSAALHEPAERIRGLLDQLIAEFDKPEHGVTVREVAGGYKMATKAEHHDGVRAFVKSLKPPLKLSLPALETLAVIA